MEEKDCVLENSVKVMEDIFSAAQPNLEEIRNKIEKLEKHHQLEILSIFMKSKNSVNQNKTGIRINLSYMFENKKNIFNEVLNYLNYLDIQENMLSEIEQQKKELSTQYYAAAETDITAVTAITANEN